MELDLYQKRCKEKGVDRMIDDPIEIDWRLYCKGCSVYLCWKGDDKKYHYIASTLDTELRTCRRKKRTKKRCE